MRLPPDLTIYALGLLPIAAGLVGLPAGARAPVSWVEPTFGFEFTFWSSETDRSRDTERLIADLVRHAPDFARRRGVVVSGTSGDTVDFAPGGRVRYGIDQRVLEITGTPQTELGYETNRLAYETLTFDLLRQFQTFPHEIVGGGHVHVGAIFDRDPQLLRDFTVDFHNHPSLAIGIFAYNPRQGLAMSEHPSNEQLEYLQAVANFDASNGSTTTAEFAVAMYALHNDRRTALNFQNLANVFGPGIGKKTLELRFAPQQSFRDFMLIIKLLRARLAWLKRHSHQPAGVPLGPRSFKEAQADFRRYVEECGLVWRDYAHFGIASWKKDPSALLRAHPMSEGVYDQFLRDAAKLKGKAKTAVTPASCEFDLGHLSRARGQDAVSERF